MTAKNLVLVTGSTGFLGSHVAMQVLEAGHRLRITVRSERTTMFDAYPDVEKCIVPDITAAGAYNGAMKNVFHIIHCASPFTHYVNDTQRDLLDPAIRGITEISRAAALSPTVSRVVITSSFVAVLDPTLSSRPNYRYTEQDWNPVTLEVAFINPRSGYQASRKFAELAARKFMSEHDPPFTLVTVCPPLIFGPIHLTPRDPASPGESCRQMLHNTKSPLAETRMPGFIDVRDAARVHVESLDSGKVTSSQQFLACGEKFSWNAVYQLGTTGSYSKTSIEEQNSCWLDTQKVELMLGIRWTPLQDTVKYVIGSIPSSFLDIATVE